MPTGAHDKHRVHKRRISDRTVDDDGEYVDSHNGRSGSGSSSESDDADIVIAAPAAKKRLRIDGTPVLASSTASPTPPTSRTTAGKSVKYDAQDVRAAILLLDLSFRDSQLALPIAKNDQK